MGIKSSAGFAAKFAFGDELLQQRGRRENGVGFLTLHRLEHVQHHVEAREVGGLQRSHFPGAAVNPVSLPGKAGANDVVGLLKIGMLYLIWFNTCCSEAIRVYYF